jgi:hypothetical protein
VDVCHILQTLTVQKMDDELKRNEEQKRERASDPLQRWKGIQKMIAWIESNLPPEKRRNRPRTHPANSAARDKAKG